MGGGRMVGYGLLMGLGGLSVFLERNRIYRKWQAVWWGRRIPPDYQQPKLVILGSGWGAVGAMQRLVPGFYDTTVVSPQNYFLFTPLLPSATVGTMETRALVESIRSLAQGCGGRYLCGEAVEIDPKGKTVRCRGTNGALFDLPYDVLVVAIGAAVNTLGIGGVQQWANQLKTIADAQAIRKRIIWNYETACLPSTSEEEARRLLSFVVVGGGPTGVEFAAELYDFIHEDLVRTVPASIHALFSVSVVQSADHILNTYDLRISNYTEQLFQREGIRVVTGAAVEAVRPTEIVYADRATNTRHILPYGLCRNRVDGI